MGCGASAEVRPQEPVPNPSLQNQNPAPKPGVSLAEAARKDADMIEGDLSNAVKAEVAPVKAKVAEDVKKVEAKAEEVSNSVQNELASKSRARLKAAEKELETQEDNIGNQIKDAIEQAKKDGDAAMQASMEVSYATHSRRRLIRQACGEESVLFLLAMSSNDFEVVVEDLTFEHQVIFFSKTPFEECLPEIENLDQLQNKLDEARVQGITGRTSVVMIGTHFLLENNADMTKNIKECNDSWGINIQTGQGAPCFLLKKCNESHKFHKKLDAKASFDKIIDAVKEFGPAK